jgi:hypothetical protein
MSVRHSEIESNLVPTSDLPNASVDAPGSILSCSLAGQWAGRARAALYTVGPFCPVRGGGGRQGIVP